MSINDRKINLKINFSKNRPLLGNNKTSTGKIDLSQNNSITIGNPNLTLTETTYTLNQLKNNYKFTDNVIHKYFKAAPLQGFTSPTLNNRTVTYIVNTATGCKTINDVVNIVYQDYQKDLILDNFLNNANRKSDKTEDLSKTKNGTKLSKNNYKQYIDEIGLATGEEAKELRRAAVNKMIQDFTQGNLSVLLLAELFKAIGITDISGSTKNNLLTYNFVFENKKYSMTCNAKEAASGTDTKTVTTYTQEDLLANKGATEELINKYFEPVSQEAGKSTNYKLRAGKTYAAFLEALKPKTEEKNGTFKSKNEAGHLVETTYVDGKVTKIVEYNSSYKSKERTETKYNKDGSKTVTIYDYNDKVKSTAKYDKNDKILDGIVESKNEAGHFVETTYKDGKVTKIVEYNSSYTKSNNRTETVYDKDGNKTITKYDYGNEVISITKYDKNNNILDGTVESKNKAGNLVETTYKDGKITKIVEYNGDKKYGEKTETKYNKDGSQTINKYDYFGQVKSTIEYDKNGKITQETQYTSDGREVTKYNTDGSKLTYVYDKEDNITLEIHTSKDGKERYLQTIVNKDGSKTRLEYANKNKGGVIAKTEYDAQGRLTYNASYSGYYVTDKKITYNADGSRTEIQYEKHNKDSKAAPKASEKNYDKNGNLISEIVYKDNKKQSETHCTYDSKGLVSKTVIQYQNELKDKETVTDKNGNKLSETVYKGRWTDPDSGTEYKSGTYGAIIQTTYDGAKTTETIKVNDGKTLLRETITDTDENTKTVNNYSNGKMNTQIVTDLNGNKLSEIGYDQNGKMLYTTKWDYKNNTEATTFADGSTSSKKIGNTTAELKSVSGTKLGVTIRGKYQVSFGTILTNSDKSNYFANTTYNCFVLKNNNDEITQRVVYNPGGSIKTIQTFTYDYTDKKNYKVIIKDSNNDTHTEVYKNGKKETTYHYFNSTKSSVVQKEGKGTARSTLTGKVTQSHVSMDAKSFYDVIINPSARVCGYTGYGLIKDITKGDITGLLLKMAQTSYSGTPTGCDVKYTGYSKLSEKYRERVKKILADLMNEYGIPSEQVQGYHFTSTSSIAKTMASNSYLKKFVKNNIKDLIKGNCDGKAFSFETGDLYYAFHQMHVVDSQLKGTKLKLTLFDVYDFDGSATGNSNSAVMNRAGNAAMKDGKLKPYYTLVEVEIDLTTLGFTKEQIQAMLK